MSARDEARRGGAIGTVLSDVAERPVRWALGVFGAVVVAAGLVYSLIEPDTSWPDGVWWALVTATTVGYGDISPASLEGRVLAGTVIFTGVATVAVLTANLAGFLAAQKVERAYGTPELDDDVDYLISQMEAFKRRVLAEQEHDARIEEAAAKVCRQWSESPGDCEEAVEELARVLKQSSD